MDTVPFSVEVHSVERQIAEGGPDGKEVGDRLVPLGVLCDEDRRDVLHNGSGDVHQRIGQREASVLSVGENIVGQVHFEFVLELGAPVVLMVEVVGTASIQ